MTLVVRDLGRPPVAPLGWSRSAQETLPVGRHFLDGKRAPWPTRCRERKIKIVCRRFDDSVHHSVRSSTESCSPRVCVILVVSKRIETFPPKLHIFHMSHHILTIVSIFCRMQNPFSPIPATLPWENNDLGQLSRILPSKRRCTSSFSACLLERIKKKKQKPKKNTLKCVTNGKIQKLSQQRNPHRWGIWNSERQIDVVTV